MRSDALKNARIFGQRGGQVVADTVHCEGGWRARTILWPTYGVPEVCECPSADATEELALRRAFALASLRYPESQTLH